MSALILVALSLTMVATAFLSGVFGMAGGMILLGVLLSLLSLPDAMALHAVTQMTSNGSRGLIWVNYVRWPPVFWFLLGSLFAFLLWAMLAYVPSKGLTLILLGTAPFLVRLLPTTLKPNPEIKRDCLSVGAISMIFMLISGVSGPLIDTFFLSSKFEKREIIATKAICQVVCHLAKLTYFGGIIAQTATLDLKLMAIAILATLLGAWLAKPVLEKLSEQTYRLWANRIITTVALIYIAQGLYYLATHGF